jgi:hypothetical protein
MKNEKRKFTAEFKVQILREHLENQVSVSKICEQYNHLVMAMPYKPKSILLMEERIICRSIRKIFK